MPISRYDPAYGGKKGAASKALTAMKSQYGEKRGTSVFYATLNKKKSEGRSYKRLAEK
jgi:hypothetical protein